MAKKTSTTKTRAKAKASRKANGRRKAAVAAAARTGTKKEQLVTMLKKGATVEALTMALGWQPHTLRASISMLGKTGIKVARERADGVTSYKIAA
jgi:hypothetical protein